MILYSLHAPSMPVRKKHGEPWRKHGHSMEERSGRVMAVPPFPVYLVLMVTEEQFRSAALGFPEATEEPHVDKTSFRVKRKIFATYDARLKRACIRLPETEQGIYCSASPGSIYPVDNKWGKQGWTLVELETVRYTVFRDALRKAYCTVAPQKLADLAARQRS
jgi:hypothetical protein